MIAFLEGARRASRRLTLGLAIVAAISGCSEDVLIDGTGGAGGSGSNAGSTSSTGSGAGGEWTTLIDGTWELEGGTEGYWCTLKTIQEDVYVKAFRAQAPEGTHHTLLLRAGGGPDGEAECGPTLGADMLHASGVGTDDLTFPEGVAVKIPAGTQLLLNLHLFNTTSSVLKGVSGTLVQTMPVDQVKQTAEMVLAGATSISVPPFGTQTVQGQCLFPGAATISTVWPHMHQYGTHMKVVHQGAAGSKVLHDGPFAFGEQKNYPIEPVNVAPGENILIECSYQNPTAQTVSWGDSSTAEMCFAGLYRYPALSMGCQ